MTNIVKFPQQRIVREDDYRVRMRVNLAALAFMAVFVLVSCWILDGLLAVPRRDCQSALRPCNVTSGPFSASLAAREF
jgi:hypothetical protein